MTKLGTIIMAGLLVSSAAACKKKDKDEGSGKTTEGSGTKGTGSGTAKASGSGSASGTAVTTEPGGKAMTAEEKVAAYQKCWTDFNDRKWDDFKTCFADEVVQKDVTAGTETTGVDAAVAHAKGYADAFSDGKGSAQLIMVNGNNILGVWLFNGTNDGVMKTPMGDQPATNKKIGVMMVHGIELNDAGKAIEEWSLMDMGSFLGQLGMAPPGMPFRAEITEGAKTPEIVIAKDDDIEKKNLEAEKAEIDAFNTHNVDGFGAMVADDAMWSELAQEKDWTKKEMLEGLKGFMSGFSDLKLAVKGSWAAGDYTVTAAQMTGTNDKPVKEMMLDGSGKVFTAINVKITHRKDGKNDKTWIFYDSMGMMKQLMGASDGGKPDGDDKPADEGDKAAPDEKTE